MRNLSLILFFLVSAGCDAQSLSDSLTRPDAGFGSDLSSIVAVADTISRDSIARDSIRQPEISEFYKRFDTAIYNNNPFYQFQHPLRLIVSEKQWQGKEVLFYLIVALLLFFALAKNNFSRYLDDLFKVFFRTTLKQRQTRDQLMAAPLPSLLFNILYALSTALFIVLLFKHFHLGDQYSFWAEYAFSISALAIIYTIKFVALKFFGWILGISEATDTYIFLVFTTNKVIGILLLPFVVGMAFMENTFYEVVFSLSICLLGALFFYRYFLSFISVRKQIVINLSHFLLYIIGFEIVPLLVINKLLVSFF